MGLVFRKQIPGKADINEIFSKRYLPRTKRVYEKFVESGGYHFGDLTAWYCGLDEKERRLWEKEIDGYYPADVQVELVRVIGAALLHKDENGYPVPIPITFIWNGKATDAPPTGIRTTFNASEQSYLIEVFGYPAPLGSSLFTRRPGKDPQEDAATYEE